MAEDKTQISVQIGQPPPPGGTQGSFVEYRDLVSYSIDSNVCTLADAFTLKIVNPAGVRTGEILPGDPVKIFAKDPRVSGGREAQLLTGIVVDITESSDDSGGTVWDISGADLGWHIVNNCGPLFKILNGLTFQKFMDEILDPSWGFRTPSKIDDNLRSRRISQGRAAVAAARAPVGTFIPPICFESGDMIADKLITYARRAKRLVNVTVDGYLQIFEPNYVTPADGVLHYHKTTESSRKLNNVKSARIRRSIEGVYTDVTCVGTVVVPSVLPNKYNPHAGTFKGFYQNASALPFKRLLTFSDGDVGVDGPNLPQATARAQWRGKRGLFDAFTAEYTFKGHVISPDGDLEGRSGTFFAPDGILAVEDTVNKISGPHYLMARRFQRSPQGGTTTILTLKKPNLLSAA